MEQNPMSPVDPATVVERPPFWPDPSYGDYLKLDRLLSAQKPLSAEHDELLFIVIHQTSELWMQLSLHELSAAREQIRRDELGPAFKMIARVSRIQAQLIQSRDVLATMTPSDYEAIRPSLGQSSGFQSYQYRELEFILGAKNAATLTVHEPDPQVHARLLKAWREPSLYDDALRLLDRRGLRLPAACVERDWTLPYVAHPEVEAARLAEVYRDPQRWWDRRELAEKESIWSSGSSNGGSHT